MAAAAIVAAPGAGAAAAAPAQRPRPSHAARFLDPYYVVNALLVVPAFVALRAYFLIATPDGSEFSRLHSPHAFEHWEQQALLTMLGMFGWQWLRRRSLDHLAHNALFYGKVVVGVTAVMVDVRLAVWYGLLVMGAAVACPQPMYPLAEVGDTVVVMGPVGIKGQVLASGSDTNWLVFAYAEQHAASKAMLPAFVELAASYASPRLRAAALDVTQWPVFARDTLRLSSNVWGGQLPAVLLFSKGREVSRLPAAAQVDEYGLRRNHYTKDDLIKRLNLKRFQAPQ